MEEACCHTCRLMPLLTIPHAAIPQDTPVETARCATCGSRLYVDADLVSMYVWYCIY